MASSPQPDNNVTQRSVNSTWGEFNNLTFLIQQAINKINTLTLVRVESCTNNGGLSPVGFVDVTPLVNQINAQGKAIAHKIIHNVPYMRVQGGTDAVIIDPKPGDIGICGFGSRDLSRVKNTKKAGSPGSFRKYDFSDALYIGGMLNGTPSQYVRFSSTGVDVVSPSEVRITSPSIRVGSQGQTLHGLINDTFETLFNNHTHGGVQTGSGNTATPNSTVGPSNITNVLQAG